MTDANGELLPDNLRRRDSNIELLRIITMLMIVAHHYVVNSGLMSTEGPILSAPMSRNSIFLLLFGAWGKAGINCFVMITGYYMCKSHITVRKFVKLIGEWLLYRYVIHIIFILAGYEKITLLSLIKVFMPINNVSQNFTACFMIFYLFIPFLNILVSRMNEKEHFYLLLLTGFVYIVFGTFHVITFNYVSWFMVVYLIASYVRVYPKKWMKNVFICGGCLIINIIIAAVSVIVCARIGIFSYAFVSDSNSLMPVMIGVFGFLFFKNVNILYIPFVNTIAASTFGVLLIHAHSDVMHQWLWVDTLDNVGQYGKPLYAIVSVLGVFFVCIVIDVLRISLLEKPFLVWWDNHWSEINNKITYIGEYFIKKLNMS